MFELVDLSLEYLLGLFAAIGIALVANPVSRGITGWLVEHLSSVPIIGNISVKQAIRLDEWIANQLHPHYAALETRVTHWFEGVGQTWKYNSDLHERQAAALAAFATWYQTKGAKEILAKAEANAKTAAAKNALTKDTPLPQKRISQKEVDIQFQKLIEQEFASHLKQDFPQFDWQPGRWWKWLAPFALLGGGVVVAPRPPSPTVAPIKAPIPQPKVKIGPPQPTTLPHTDDSPHPEPGTQLVPGVVSAKDKWARGQIVKLRKYEESTRKHLGPLAFLALPAAAIGTLLGLLECKNFGRFGKALCGLPSNLFNDLLALLVDFLVLTNICTIIPWLEDAADEVLPFLTDFTTGVAALTCAAGSPQPKALDLPTLSLPSSVALTLSLPPLHA